MGRNMQFVSGCNWAGYGKTLRSARLALATFTGGVAVLTMSAAIGLSSADELLPLQRAASADHLRAVDRHTPELVVLPSGQPATAAHDFAGGVAGEGECAWYPFTSGEVQPVYISGQPFVNVTVHAVTVWEGDLIVGGAFKMAGGQTVTNIARWDGSEWHPFNAGGQIGVSHQANWFDTGDLSIISVTALTVWNGDLIAGGLFVGVGGEEVNGIARWDGSAWHPFTSGSEIGVNMGTHGGGVFALTVWNGDLIAGGWFGTAGGQTVNRIARWDGTEWHPFTSGGEIGLSGSVRTLTVWNGKLIAGGWFTTAGGQTVNRIARWDGAQWHPFTSGGEIGVNSGVRVLTVWNGDLIAGGPFTTAGGQTVNHLARWDGTEWHPFTAGGEIGVSGAVRALFVHNDHLIAGGTFLTAGDQTVNHIARWDGSEWHPYDVDGEIGVDISPGHSVFVLSEWNNDLIVAGTFVTAGTQSVHHIVQWDGMWNPVKSGGQTGVGSLVGVSGAVYALTEWNDDLIVGGGFANIGGNTVFAEQHHVNRIARWDGTEWYSFSSGGETGVDASVRVLTVWNGDLIVGGWFATAGGQTVNRVARWDGAQWHPFTSGGEIGVGGSNVLALKVWNGDLIAGGNFTTAGGQTVNHIARWDGAQWHPFTSGGEIGVNDDVRTLAVWNGDLIAGGTFTTAGGQTVNRIARWDGSAWHPFSSNGEIGMGGSLFGWVNALALWNGDLVAGGLFFTVGDQALGHIARWDGTQWHPFTSSGEIGVSAAPPGVLAFTVWYGDLIAGGNFTTAGGQTVNRIARWDGSAWHPFTAAGAAHPTLLTGTNSVVEALMVWKDDLIVGGQFITAGDKEVNRITSWRTCRASEPVPPCPGDLNGDGVVNGFDLVELLSCWGPVAPGCEAADINGDTLVNGFDLVELLSTWGACP